jgi:hypothetical protein
MWILALSAFVAASASFADNGHVVGNGGNSVVCPADVSRSEIFRGGTTILDLIEGQTYDGLHFHGLSALRKLPLERAFPQAVATFLRNSFFEQNQFRSRFANRATNTRFVAHLPSLGVFSPGVQARGCSLKQAAIQYGSEQPSPLEEISLEISAPLWNSFTTDQQVALLFHEYLLKDRLVQEGPCAVDGVRHLTAYVLSDEGLAATPSNWSFELSHDCSRPDPGR